MPHHRRASLAAALAMVAALLMACSFPPTAEAQPQPGRVRKELRRLSKQEVQMFVQAINVMQNTPTEVGQAQYRPAYKDWKYFIVKHAVAGSDPRGDQGHGAPCFMTFHRSFLLEVEAAVLSIVPDLKALPYWDITRDLRGGDISRTSRNYIFSSNWFGHLDGNPNEDYAVTDGLFPRTPVPTYTPPLGHEDTEPIYSGDTSTGRLRSDGNSNPRPYVTRMPVKGATDAYLGSPFHSLFFVSSPRPNELPLNYKAFDYWFCTDANIIQDWVDWSTCADVSTLYNSGASDDDVLNLIRTTRAPLLHPSPHWLVGGGLGDTAVGDFTDVVASTNEAALFLTHHTNIDRQNMIWQQNALNFDPSAAQRSWGFPATEDDYPNGWTGCYLNDVITSAFGFTDIFPGLAPSNPQGYTHADVLALTAPGVVTYSYDRMTPPAASKKGKGDEGKGQGKGGESKSKGEGEGKGKGKGRRSLREEEAAAAGGSFKWPKFYTPKHHRRQAQQAQA